MSANILLIEGDTVLLHLVEQALKEKGYEVTSLSTYRKAMKFIDSPNDMKKIDLILLDRILPDVTDGVELLQKLLVDQKGKRDVIIFSLLSSEKAISQALEMGAKDYIAKPVHIGQMVKRIEKYLSHKKKSKKK